MCPYSVCIYTSSSYQSYATATPASITLFSGPGQPGVIMPHRCIAGGCWNTRKDGVSLHKWPEDAHFAKLWTNAVKNTRSDIFNPFTSRLCSAHFTEDSFEEQSVIAKSLGLKMKPNAIPTIFKNGPPQAKRLKRHDKNVSQEAGAGRSKHAQRPPRGAYRKREAARVC